MTITRLHGALPTALAMILAVAPKAPAQDLAETLQRAPDLSGFAEGIRLTDVAPDGAATIFAPTNEAFLNLPHSLRDRLERHPDVMRDVLAAHVVPGARHEADDLPVEMETLAGQRMLATYTGGALTVRLAQPESAASPEAVMRARAANEARVVAGDLSADEALVHAVDAVLLPLGLEEALDLAEAGVDRQAPAAQDNGADGQTAEPEPTDFAGQIARAGDGESGGAAQELDTYTYTVEIEEPRRDPSVAVPDEGRTVSVPRIVLSAPSDPEDGAQQDRPQQRAESQGGDADTQQGSAREIDVISGTISASRLLNRPVRDRSGAELGTVTDLMISLDTARIDSLVYEIDTGLLGLGSDRRSVPIADVSIDPVDGAVVVPAGAAEGGDGSGGDGN